MPCHGRVLAYPYAADGTMVNEEIVRAGYAVASVYPPNMKHVERMHAAQAAARDGLARAVGWIGVRVPAPQRQGYR